MSTQRGIGRRKAYENKIISAQTKKGEKKHRTSVPIFTQTHWHCDDLFRDFVHQTRLSSPRGIYNVRMKSPSFFEVHRDSREKKIRGISFERGIPATYDGYHQRRSTKTSGGDFDITTYHLGPSAEAVEMGSVSSGMGLKKIPRHRTRSKWRFMPMPEEYARTVFE